MSTSAVSGGVAEVDDRSRGAVDDGGRGRVHRLADVFPVMWAAGHLVHIGIHEGSGRVDPTEVLVVAAAVALLGRPRSRRWLLGLAAAQVLDWLSQAPYNPDHWNLVLGVNLILLTVGLVGRRADPVTAAAPALRLALLIAYGAAALAKLNTGFLDTTWSCAVELGHRATFGAVTVVPGHRPVLIAITVAAELLVFLGLAIPRTRSGAVRLGTGFHGLLALSPAVAVWDFTTILWALFALFLPARELDAAVRRVAASVDGSPVARLLARHRWPALVGLGLLSLSAGLQAERGLWSLVWIPFLPYFLFVAVGLFGTPRSGAEPRRVAPSLLALPALGLLAFTALNPYLGLRTTGAFTMFSNLRTEGPGGNHLILPSWHPTDHQNDWFVVESASDPDLATVVEHGRALTRTTVRQLSRPATGQSMTGAFADGEPVVWTDHGSDRLVGAPTWVERWALSFRPVALEGEPGCGN